MSGEVDTRPVDLDQRFTGIRGRTVDFADLEDLEDFGASECPHDDRAHAASETVKTAPHSVRGSAMARGTYRD
jgi:hypothetical protein